MRVGLPYLVWDASWTNFASPGPHEPRFRRSGDVPGWFLKGFGVVCEHAFCCASRCVFFLRHKSCRCWLQRLSCHSPAHSAQHSWNNARTVARNVFICAVATNLQWPPLCLLSFLCGGLCAAHPPRPEGSAERTGQFPNFFLFSLPLKPASKFRLEIPASSAFPYPSFPSPKDDSVIKPQNSNLQPFENHCNFCFYFVENAPRVFGQEGVWL